MRVALLHKRPCETWSGNSFPGAINSTLIGVLHAVAALPSQQMASTGSSMREEDFSHLSDLPTLLWVFKSGRNQWSFQYFLITQAATLCKEGNQNNFIEPITKMLSPSGEI